MVFLKICNSLSLDFRYLFNSLQFFSKSQDHYQNACYQIWGSKWFIISLCLPIDFLQSILKLVPVVLNFILKFHNIKHTTYFHFYQHTFDISLSMILALAEEFCIELMLPDLDTVDDSLDHLGFYNKSFLLLCKASKGFL